MTNTATSSPGPSASSLEHGKHRAAQGVYLKGTLYCLAASVSFGLMFPVMASALTRVDPFTFTSLRYLIAAAVSLVLLRITEGPNALDLQGEPIALAWLLGSVGFAGFGFLVFLGQQLAGRDGALTTSIMAATQPLLGILIISVVRRVLPPLVTMLLVLLSFGGVALVITKGDVGGLLREPQNYSANALIVLGMIFWLIYTFSAARFARWSALKYTTMTMSLGLTTIVAINAILALTRVIALPGPADLLFIVPHLLYMSLIASVVGVLCWNLGNKILTPLNGVLFMDVVPITAFTVSAIAGVVPTRIQIAGACMTGVALILNNLYLRLRA
ncbi:DMT family transporter [Bradyrhizobium viridifuturi]|jgi:drug/metabolite transporter (DMT)-like permease|uniref:DMT family transporter n=1 Tax=Bradyrhizobium TaxID=374 RepID=UPI000397AD99|nr:MULTISPECIES: DMT family transporter [Bradyrhizobium]ERF79659.1 MAG: two-component system, OmpR family, response regulator [Bradyrhizobium sp. DFCI-1]MCA3796725.1 DMT family transporter [Burkholderia sp.]OYU61380.1 MAG: EamA family transporter [Bradyrhizobium sp. PARBB1]PSO19668.1 EamA family transporter [Bradyrhizobium sp. MOS004]QRI72295.1 DMT family transporter [Bradyrhizobium sp. PSBB068]